MICMKALEKITLRNIRMNRKRTWVTIIGIMLATALIVVVADMAVSFRASMIEYEKINSGDYHYCFHAVEPENLKYFQENRNIDRMGLIADMGYTRIEDAGNKEKPYLFLKAMDEQAMEVVNVTVLEGRLPENSHEVILSEGIRRTGNTPYQIGDVLHLENQDRYNAEGLELDQSCNYMEGETLTDGVYAGGDYTVVGIMKRLMPEQEVSGAPGYTVITRMEDPNAYRSVDIYATYTKTGLKHRDAVTAGLMGIPEDLYQRYQSAESMSEEEWKALDQCISSYVVCNQWLLKYELLQFSEENLQMLYAVAGVAIVIIIVSSVFCIRNSFVISLTEKMKLYGMLASVGTTRRQRKKVIYGEALLLGLVGIPMGIALGLLAGWIVVKGTGHLLEQSLNVELRYVISLPALLISILLSVVTILLSGSQAAHKAAKVSPIRAIRGNDTVRLSRKEVRMPKWLEKWFGIGGKIAYKNLRRARNRYRTTVISIVVSVAVFVGMSGFISMAMSVSKAYYKESTYQLGVYVYSSDQIQELDKIADIEGVEQVVIARFSSLSVPAAEIKYSDRYRSAEEPMEEDQSESLVVAALDPQSFRDYVKQTGGMSDAGDQSAILVNQGTMIVQQDGKEKQVVGDLYAYRAGDEITGTLGGDQSVTFTIAKTTDQRPTGLETIRNGLLIINSDAIAAYEPAFRDAADAYVVCEDPDQVEQEIQDRLNLFSEIINNKKEEYESSKALYTLIGVFLYGFIIVIALIGITNIFNTITTNMELRSREFATLKSVGMTRKEFQRVIWLEGIFYGLKSLLIGLPLGIGLSVVFHVALASGSLETPYELPVVGILISVAAVFLLLFGIMRYSMGKINQKNIIETIQNENI